MSFLRKMFSGRVASDDPRRFVVEAMLGAMSADGEITDDEMATLEGNLENHQLFHGMSGEELTRLTDVAADAIREAGGSRARVGAIAKGLPARHQRLAAYALACEICVADKQLAESEIDYLDALQAALDLPDTEAEELFEAAREHSGLRTLEEKSERVRQMMPAFVQCMALMAAADGEIHHEERLGMRAVLRNIPDMSVLTAAELDEAIDVALDRVEHHEAAATLESVADSIHEPADRYWTAVYVMIIALADGKKDWREIRFLEDMRGTFRLSEHQMDQAMKTAALFPAVDLGGDAPS